MDWSLFVALGGMMFLEYAIWGAWAPVLAARLLGPLKMSGKQTGWIYATLPLACILSPLVAGHVADRWLATEWILAACHLTGAVLLLIAARQEKFNLLFVVMFLYSLCYAATMPLVNSLMFSHLTDPRTQSAGIFIWGPIAWALVGYFLAGWRWMFKTEGAGRDCLYLAAVLSAVMGIGCFFLPHTPPRGSAGEAWPLIESFAMLRDADFRLFLAISLIVAGLMQFYFLGTARFLIDMGLPGKMVSAVMAIAQAAQALATWWALTAFLKPDMLGVKWTLVVGAACWMSMYFIYAAGKPRWLMIASQPLHGLAYVFFIIAGQIYADAVAPANIRGSVQALVFAATTGVGMFFGTQAAGAVMDWFSAQGKFQWRKIWLVPAAIALACLVVFMAGFHG